MTHPFMKTDAGRIDAWQPVASGLAAVWATEKIQKALFDAVERREVYGTTDPRMGVRFFDGWELTERGLSSR